MDWYVKTFQELSNEELYELLKARVDVFVVEQNCPYPELDNYDQVSIHLFSKIENELAANIRILPAGSKFKEASIGRVLVVEKYRKQGIASQLVQKGIDYIQSHWKGTCIKIQAQHHLENFYSSLGFRTISEVYIEDGIPHIDMIWEAR